MRILITGATGQLARYLREALINDEVAAMSHAQLDVTDSAAVLKTLQSLRPEIVINTAAFHRVDDCEAQVEKSFQVNAFAVRGLALACRGAGAVLVHFSTDYVFGGEKREPYLETDLARPISVYGASKLAGEHLLAAALPEHFIIRTCGLYGVGGSESKGGNFVETMARRAIEKKPTRVVADQIVTPTFAGELAAKVIQLMRTRNYGLYHITNNGSCSWYEFARKVFQFIGSKTELAPTTSKEFGAPAARPAYSVLHNGRLLAMGLDDLSSWQEALECYFAQRRKTLGAGGT